MLPCVATFKGYQGKVTFTTAVLLNLDEGACVFLECSSSDKRVQDEIREKVLHTVKKRKLLPEKTTNGIFPSILVVCCRPN